MNWKMISVEDLTKVLTELPVEEFTIHNCTASQGTPMGESSGHSSNPYLPIGAAKATRCLAPCRTNVNRLKLLLIPLPGYAIDRLRERSV